MSGVLATRDTYRLALQAAIEWQHCLLAAHRPAIGAIADCCTPRQPCSSYTDDLELLRRFRAALTRLDAA